MKNSHFLIRNERRFSPQGWRERDPGGGDAAPCPGIAGRESPLPDAEGRPSSPPRRLSGAFYLRILQLSRQRERAHSSAHRTAAAPRLRGAAQHPDSSRGRRPGRGRFRLWPRSLPFGSPLGSSSGQSEPLRGFPQFRGSETAVKEEPRS